MADEPKQVLTPPPTRLLEPLIITAIIVVVVGIFILVAGKFVFGGVVALFGAVLGIGSQVSKSSKL